MKNKEIKQVSLVMVGISGMGYYYVKILLDEFSPDLIKIQAAVDPYPEKSELYQELKDRKIPIFPSLSELYKSGINADLAIISSPIHFHVPQTCEALLNGSYVICEKPLGATIQEAEKLIHTRDAVGRWVMIGYQWSFSEAIRALKRDIGKGLLGKPIRLKTLCFWQRDENYYRISGWAGKIKDKKGNWILDSPANNAMAHFLHNLFYVLGERADTSARPAEVTAELYRAFPIENYDSTACRAFTEDGTELLFYASHSAFKDRGPMFSFEFERATVDYGEFTDVIIMDDNHGNVKNYGSPEADHHFKKLFEAVTGVRNPKPVLCGPEAASSQTLCINGMQESAPEIVAFPESMIHRVEETGKLWVKGLDKAFYDCYKKGILPSEVSFPWARRGKKIDLRNYRYFPGGTPPEERNES